MPGKAVLLLDGGTGHLLKAKGVEQLIGGLKYEELFLAGSLANAQRPDLVQDVHREYIDAGADVITVNCFACTAFSLAKIGKAHLADCLIAAAGRLARQVADQADRHVQVAGSLPPLQESYQTRGLPAPHSMQQQYQHMAAVLAPYVDLLLCETLASIAEGQAAAAAASSSGKPWWISWTLQDNEDGLLRGGERIEDAVAAVCHLPGLQAVLVNCCAPQAVSAAIPRLVQCAPDGVMVGGYANGFKTTTSEWLASSGEDLQPGGFIVQPAEEYDSEGMILPEAYARHAQQWRSQGASIVGGCCGVGPEHIICIHRAPNPNHQSRD